MSSNTNNKLSSNLNNSKKNYSSKVNAFLDKINSKNKTKIILEKYNDDEVDENESNLEKELSDINSNSSQIEELEYELETKYNTGLPKNYGSKWSQNEISYIFEKLKKGDLKDLTESSEVIKKIAKKLNRSVGGVYVIIKKTIFDKYLNGYDPESISNEFNITFQSVKSIIKSFITKDSDITINLLEKENKLLKLKIENIKLKKELKLLN